MSLLTIQGRGAIDGIVEGYALVSEESIQGWGGIDEKTGLVIEENHPFKGYSIKDSILIISGGKGSTGWSCHFHAAKVNNVGPAAMVFRKIDSRTGVAAAVLNVPVLTDLEDNPFELIQTGDYVRVDGKMGTIELIKRKE